MRSSTISALALVLIVAQTAQAQELATTFDQLRVLLKQDDTLTVTDSGGQRLRGKLSRLSSGLLILNISGAMREFHAGEIHTIQMRKADPLGNGALTGLAIGAGLAAAVALQPTGGGLGWIPLLAVVYGGIGSGIGAGVDALIERDRVIYARSSPSISIAPVFGNRRPGVFVAVRLPLDFHNRRE
jgi:hypothetical protein